MIFARRIKPNEEMMEMKFNIWICAKIYEGNICHFIKDLKSIKSTIPFYLKRVKKIETNFYVLLYPHTNNFNLLEDVWFKPYKYVIADDYKPILEKYDIEELYTTKVPLFKAITLEQHNQSNIIWPTYFSIHEKPEAKFSNEIYMLIKEYKDENVCSGQAIFHDPISNKIVYNAYDRNKIFKHAIFTGIEEISFKTSGYLCSGLDLYLKTEPCLACTIALVHGRIGRVFFTETKIPHVYSEVKINHRKHLNHRYDVYEIINL